MALKTDTFSKATSGNADLNGWAGGDFSWVRRYLSSGSTDLAQVIGSAAGYGEQVDTSALFAAYDADFAEIASARDIGRIRITARALIANGSADTARLHILFRVNPSTGAGYALQINGPAYNATTTASGVGAWTLRRAADWTGLLEGTGSTTLASGSYNNARAGVGTFATDTFELEYDGTNLVVNHVNLGAELADVTDATYGPSSGFIGLGFGGGFTLNRRWRFDDFEVEYNVRPPKGGGSTAIDPNPAATRVLTSAKLQLPVPPRLYSDRDQAQVRRMIERFLTQLSAGIQSGQDQTDVLVTSAVTVLDDLEDVTITSPGAASFLRYDTSSQEWIDGLISYADISGALSLNDLSDVTITSPADNSFLRYDTSSSQWIDEVVTIPVVLDDLADVNTLGAVTDMFLRFDGTTWIAESVAIPPGLPATTTVGDMLASDGDSFEVLTVGPDGYVLTANSAEPLGVEWAPAGSGSLPTTTTVGDILASDGDSFEVLGPGPDGYVLTANSAEPLGVEWAPAGGALALDDLTDVNVPSPNDGDVLTYDTSTSEWIASPPAGGGGSPGGSDTEVQYNDGGSFGGTPDAVITATGNLRLNDYLELDQTTLPALPSSGDNRVTAHADAGRPLLWWSSASGLGRAWPFQPSFWQRRITRIWVEGSTTLGAEGCALTLGGNRARQAVGSSSFRASQVLMNISTNTTLNAIAQVSSDIAICYRGNTNSRGGFFAYWRFGTGATAKSDESVLIGLANANSGLASAVASTYATDQIGFCKDGTDTNYQFVRRSASGTAQKTDLGRAPATGEVYEMWIYAPPASSDIYVRVVVWTDANSATELLNTSYSSDLPVNTTALFQAIVMRNNSAGTAVDFDLHCFYCESDW